jgi:hypothetical protein
MKNKKLLPDVYGSAIWLLVGTAEELNRHFERKTGQDGPLKEGVRGHYSPCTDAEGNTLRFIFLPTDRNRNKFERVAILSHEVTHAVMCVLSDRGVQISHENDEAFAYYHEWLFRQCLREVW